MTTALCTLKRKASGKRGFTLVELVIVIAILAILAAIAIPTVSHLIGQANTATDESNAQTINMAIKTYASEYAANKASGTNPYTGDDVLAKYTLNETIFTPRVTDLGKRFCWDNDKQNVVIAAPAGKIIEIKTTTSFTFASINGEITAVAGT